MKRFFGMLLAIALLLLTGEVYAQSPPTVVLTQDELVSFVDAATLEAQARAAAMRASPARRKIGAAFPGIFGPPPEAQPAQSPVASDREHSEK